MMSEAIDYYYTTDIDYANKRLSNTFVKTKNAGLVYVEQIHPDPAGGEKSHIVRGVVFSTKAKTNLLEPHWGLASAWTPVAELDLSPITLGYVFSKGLEKGIFISRYPMRNLYKQGLSANALSFSDGNSRYFDPTELFSPMLNLYPTVKQAWEIVKKGTYSVPFSRAFAVRNSGFLEYMGRQIVGRISEQNASVVPVLQPKFAFLQQHLDWSTK